MRRINLTLTDTETAELEKARQDWIMKKAAGDDTVQKVLDKKFSLTTFTTHLVRAGIGKIDIMETTSK